jgi:hypothetical protein
LQKPFFHQKKIQQRKPIMPNWDRTIPDDDRKCGYRLERTPPDGTFTAIVTCHELIGCYTHYWGGRTMPCERPDCPACNANSPTRWHAFLSVWNPSTHDHVIFQCTAKAAVAFEEYQSSHGTLLGCHFRAHRPKRRRNAQVVIDCRPADLTKLRLPAAPNIMQAMAVIWQIPGAALVADEAVRGAPLVKALSHRMGEAFDNPADGNGRCKPPEVRA